MSEGELRRRLDSVTEELLAVYEELEVLSGVATIANTTADVAVAGRRILEEAAGLLEADVAFIVYSDSELRAEAPAPLGVTLEERDAIAEVLGEKLAEGAGPILKAPFAEGAAIPHAPDSLMVVPLRCQDEGLGAICLGRRGEKRAFTAGDLKLLSVLGSSAAAVLLQRKNLDLARITRVLEERNNLFQGILSISHEIAASLDLDRLLHAITNLPARLLGFDRCAVLLEEGGRRRLRAVSGVGRVDRADPELASLERFLDWVAGRGEGVLVRRSEDGSVKSRPPGAADKARAHMETYEVGSLLAVILSDDQGLLGVLSFESGQEDFVSETRLEGATILAYQATVGVRNAHLYGEVPLIGLLAPVGGMIARLKALPRRRLAGWGAAAMALLAVLLFGRWELRVPGTVTVMPSKVVQVSARTRGVIQQLGPYQEGDRVEKGAVLARLDTHELGLQLNDALARARTAAGRMVQLEAEGNAAELSLARVENQRWQIEAEHLASRIDEAVLRAPIEGILLTPRLEERAGELLEVGGLLCVLADVENLRVEIAVSEKDAGVLVRDEKAAAGGELSAVLKFHAFPEIDYEAEVTHVRAAAEMVGAVPSLVAEGIVTAPGRLKPGMTGLARIEAGTRPILSLLLRKPYRLVRSMIWL